MSGHCKICGDTGCNGERHEKSFKHQIVDSAVQGLIDGGLSKSEAEKYWILFERIYEVGYKEAIRNQKEVIATSIMRNVIFTGDVSQMSTKQFGEYIDVIRKKINESNN